MDHLGRALFFNNATGWEPEILRVLPSLARLSPGILDVGAHTGLFTLVALAANPTARRSESRIREAIRTFYKDLR